MRCILRSCAVGVVVLATALASGGALAQTASQITPGSFAPPVQGGLGGGLAVGASPGLDTPAGADRLFVTLRGVTIEGGFPALAAEGETVRARLAGRRVSGAEIFAASRDLEAAYAKAGYVLVRVTLPQQKLVDGATLRLLVIDGFIERIETGKLQARIQPRIAGCLRRSSASTASPSASSSAACSSAVTCRAWCCARPWRQARWSAQPCSWSRRTISP